MNCESQFIGTRIVDAVDRFRITGCRSLYFILLIEGRPMAGWLTRPWSHSLRLIWCCFSRRWLLLLAIVCLSSPILFPILHLLICMITWDFVIQFISNDGVVDQSNDGGKTGEQSGNCVSSAQSPILSKSLGNFEIVVREIGDSAKKWVITNHYLLPAQTVW